VPWVGAFASYSSDVFYGLNGFIHVLKYVVRCMLNYGPIFPWFIYMYGVF
jgi:hypothetical protein